MGLGIFGGGFWGKTRGEGFGLKRGLKPPQGNIWNPQKNGKFIERGCGTKEGTLLTL